LIKNLSVVNLKLICFVWNLVNILKQIELKVGHNLHKLVQRFPNNGSQPGSGPRKQNGGAPKYLGLILNFIIINLNNLNR